MCTVGVVLLHNATQLLCKQGNELPAEAGAGCLAAFAHAVIRYQHL